MLLIRRLLKNNKIATRLARFAKANQSDAYRASYESDRMSAKRVWEEACRLEKHPKVTLRLAEVQSQAAAKAKLSRVWVLERLMRNAAELKEAAAKYCRPAASSSTSTSSERGRP